MPTKIHLVKAMVFPVDMYGCESWTIKKAEHWRIDAFERWCWRRLLRVPWTARRSNQSILKEISPGISLEGLMPKLKLQYFGHLMRRVDSLEKTVMLGGVGGRSRTSLYPPLFFPSVSFLSSKLLPSHQKPTSNIHSFPQFSLRAAKIHYSMMCVPIYILSLKAIFLHNRHF